MEMFRQVVYHTANILNLLIVAYFFLGNGIYTLLMSISLAAVWIHNRCLTSQNLDDIRHSPTTPPVTIIMPAFNEQEIIVSSVRSALQVDYPGMQLVVVDDGSTDATLERLIGAFGLARANLIYRAALPTARVEGCYLSAEYPNLLVVRKQHGGKPDALNAGINCCRSPYFCSLDADCIMERDALLRLMRPVLGSPVNTVVSGGIVRILNGCHLEDGRVVEVRLPHRHLERFQVVEYLRAFLFGRTGWNLLGGTLIVSGALALYHRETVTEAGGFKADTVTEDMELIARLYHWATKHRRRIRISFTSDPICWTQGPSSFAMLARQRRRWQLGLCQTLWKYSEMLFNPRYGTVGLLSYPFHVLVEGLGAPVEVAGYLMVPLALLFGLAPPRLYLAFIFLSLCYAALLSAGAVLLEEFTYRRYPAPDDLRKLLWYALWENFGYRQVVVWYRLQGVLRFIAGLHKWERVVHGADHLVERGAEGQLPVKA
jgi:cellulose synthase/poly-beta-1,6-N-acetylglucosamine synthase-like glycosyltransferase